MSNFCLRARDHVGVFLSSRVGKSSSWGVGVCGARSWRLQFWRTVGGVRYKSSSPSFYLDELVHYPLSILEKSLSGHLFTRLLPAGLLCSLPLARVTQRWTCSQAAITYGVMIVDIHIIQKSLFCSILDISGGWNTGELLNLSNLVIEMHYLRLYPFSRLLSSFKVVQRPKKQFLFFGDFKTM